MSNSSIEEELPSLSTVRRCLIRQSLGKDLGRSRATASSLSDNSDYPFQPLYPEEQKKAFYRHKLLADCEKATRPTNPCIPEDIEILDIEPVKVHYHRRSFANTHFDQYGSHVGNSLELHPKLSSCKGWQDKFFFLSVPADFPIRRTFYRPHPRFNTIPERELGRHELRAVSHFDIVESEDDEGRSLLAPKVWVPNVGYILGNDPLSHVGLCWTDCYGVDKLDNKKLRLSADRKRVIRRCRRAPNSSYDTLASYCIRASPVNPKRKSENMDDDQSKKRKLSTLRNRRVGNVGVVNPRQSDTQAEKKSRENDNQARRSSPSSKPAEIEDKTVVQSSEPITKKMTDRLEIEDLTHASDSPPPHPNEIG
uniref:Uncharacterized protein n=1 Tax=Chenopodium quinoa TaxID=63459 RepID=A0A803N0K9_CHEQI